MHIIQIRGARTHNLQNIDLDLPRGKLIVFTGLSGSGKSSLAFDTIYAEGQRRYVESLSTYARQFLSLMEKPDVDLIEGLSPAISIEQKAASHNPRSTVGTVTEIHDYLRLLFARVGEPYCPTHATPLAAQTVSQMVDQIMALPDGTRLMLVAPVVAGRKGEHQQLLSGFRAQGFIRARIDGQIVELDPPPQLARSSRHDIDIVVDRIVVRPGSEQRLAESFETALGLADGVARAVPMAGDGQTQPRDLIFSARFACPQCGYSVGEITPRLFSFNSPLGACPDCDGLGVREFFDPGRVVHEPGLSLAAGAIQGWDRRNGFYFNLIRCLAEHYGFELDAPFANLPAAVRQAILYGSGSKPIAFRYLRHDGGVIKRSHPFEGVVPSLERRYRDSESSAVKEDLAQLISTSPCPTCNGARLRIEARHVFVSERSIDAISALTIDQAQAWFASLKLADQRAAIAAKISSEISARLGFLINVGLDYLTLDRTANTLSGGEAQRIRLASQIGSGLVGVMYVLDEPSIGLHQRDNGRLLDTLFRLRDLGNTVIVVEHDEEAIRNADHVVDLGPGAGRHGGQIIAEGPPAAIEANPDSVTGRYLRGTERIALPQLRTPSDPKRQLQIRGARGHNLQGVDVDIPIGLLVCVTGVSGSGKSTLINHTLYPAVAHALYRSRLDGLACDTVDGIDQLDKVIDIDQSPIGRTPRSNPATYTGLFTPIRELFSATPEARARGYKPGRFSFNVKGGRCEACQGDGLVKVEMHFLPDVYVTCDACRGARYNRETLDIRYRGATISEVLNLTVEAACPFFAAVPAIKRKLDTLLDVGLGYISLGQSATTLSGGEAQRIKLARELSRRDTGRTLYILDEPTTGLHFHDVRQLLSVLHRLRDGGSTVVVIEHNLDVIKTADWVIDLGPEGGARGGRLIACGTPEEIACATDSYTGRYLADVLDPAGQVQAAS